MSQVRLIDDRILYCYESRYGYEALNGYDMEMTQGYICSTGKGMRNWEKTEEVGHNVFYTEEESKENFIQDCLKDFEINESQIQWIDKDKFPRVKVLCGWCDTEKMFNHFSAGNFGKNVTCRRCLNKMFGEKWLLENRDDEERQQIAEEMKAQEVGVIKLI